MKKVLLSLTLCLCLLLSSCWMPRVYKQIEEMEEYLDYYGQSPQESTSEQSPTTSQSDSYPELPTTQEDEPEDRNPLHEYVPYEDFEREYEPFLESVPFSQMEYSRPDAQGLRKAYEAVQAMVEAQEEVDKIVEAYEQVFEDHCYFNTMHSYAYIRYSLDLSDSYYDEEYNWCEEQSPLLSQAEEKCFVAMAESPLRDKLEEAYFEEGFFEFYDENRIYSKDEVVALMQEEADLQAQYLELQNNMTISWQGREQSVKDLLDDPQLSYNDLITVYNSYYNKYSPLCADLFAKLIRVRKEIAKEVGVESYADFAYTYTYERDYSPQEVESYCDSISEEFSSLLYTAIMAQAGIPSADLEESLSLFSQTVESLGGVLKTAYEYMLDYELWDCSSSTSKLPGSYVTYLTSYEMPFLYVSPANTLSDFLTVSHEFGHFTDSFVNNGGSNMVDVAEIFSQGLEFIALCRGDLDPADRSVLTRGKASDSTLVFLGQACYAEFEARAYELPEEKLNAQGLNELFLEVNEKYGMDILYAGIEELLAPGWIDVQHFFIAPYYVISYVVSNDVALQIYQQELLDGTGLELYYDLMISSPDKSLGELLEEAEMTSPFDQDRVEELARFLKSQFKG